MEDLGYCAYPPTTVAAGFIFSIAKLTSLDIDLSLLSLISRTSEIIIHQFAKKMNFAKKLGGLLTQQELNAIHGGPPILTRVYNDQPERVNPPSKEEEGSQKPKVKKRPIKEGKIAKKKKMTSEPVLIAPKRREKWKFN